MIYYLVEICGFLVACVAACISIKSKVTFVLLKKCTYVHIKCTLQQWIPCYSSQWAPLVAEHEQKQHRFNVVINPFLRSLYINNRQMCLTKYVTAAHALQLTWFIPVNSACEPHIPTRAMVVSSEQTHEVISCPGDNFAPEEVIIQSRFEICTVYYYILASITLLASYRDQRIQHLKMVSGRDLNSVWFRVPLSILISLHLHQRPHPN